LKKQRNLVDRPVQLSLEIFHSHLLAAPLYNASGTPGYGGGGAHPHWEAVGRNDVGIALLSCLVNDAIDYSRPTLLLAVVVLLPAPHDASMQRWRNIIHWHLCFRHSRQQVTAVHDAECRRSKLIFLFADHTLTFPFVE